MSKSCVLHSSTPITCGGMPQTNSAPRTGAKSKAYSTSPWNDNPREPEGAG